MGLGQGGGHRHTSDMTSLMLVYSAVLLLAGVQDNSFLLEEAYNQDPGVVQHIVTGSLEGDRDAARIRQGEATFTQEWPVGSIRHQLSYTLPFGSTFVRKKAHWETEDQGVADVQLNYRFAALLEDPIVPAVAPRLSITLPIGDEERGLSSGAVGYEAGIPVSKELGSVAVHANVILGLTPGVDRSFGDGTTSPKRDLVHYALGGSTVLIAHDFFQPLVEVLAEWEDDIDETGALVRTQSTVVSPGLRWGFDTSAGQLVVGAAMPLGVTDDAPTAAGFLYLSFEHGFARK